MTDAGESKPPVSEAEIQRRMDFADAASNLAGHQVTDPVLREITRQVAAETLTAEEAKVLVLAHIDAQASHVRRDGAALQSILMTAITRNQNDVAAALKSLFSWTAEFTPAELAAYAAEIKQLAASASELDTYGSLLRAQREWQETATAYAMGPRPVEVPSSQPVTVDRIIGRTFEVAPTVKGDGDGI
jgi:hypothetical protein